MIGIAFFGLYMARQNGYCTFKKERELEYIDAIPAPNDVKRPQLSIKPEYKYEIDDDINRVQTDDLSIAGDFPAESPNEVYSSDRIMSFRDAKFYYHENNQTVERKKSWNGSPSKDQTTSHGFMN